MSDQNSQNSQNRQDNTGNWDDFEVISIEGLYAYVNMDAYRANIRRNTFHEGGFAFDESDMPVKVTHFSPATPSDSTWIGITTRRNLSTSFPIDLIKRFTQIVPDWDKDNGDDGTS